MSEITLSLNTFTGRINLDVTGVVEYQRLGADVIGDADGRGNLIGQLLLNEARRLYSKPTKELQELHLESLKK